MTLWDLLLVFILIGGAYYLLRSSLPSLMIVMVIIIALLLVTGSGNREFYTESFTPLNYSYFNPWWRWGSGTNYNDYWYIPAHAQLDYWMNDPNSPRYNPFWYGPIDNINWVSTRVY